MQLIYQKVKKLKWMKNKREKRNEEWSKVSSHVWAVFPPSLLNESSKYSRKFHWPFIWHRKWRESEDKFEEDMKNKQLSTVATIVIHEPTAKNYLWIFSCPKKMMASGIPFSSSFYPKQNHEHLHLNHRNPMCQTFSSIKNKKRTSKFFQLGGMTDPSFRSWRVGLTPSLFIFISVHSCAVYQRFKKSSLSYPRRNIKNEEKDRKTHLNGDQLVLSETDMYRLDLKQ